MKNMKNVNLTTENNHLYILYKFIIKSDKLHI